MLDWSVSKMRSPAWTEGSVGYICLHIAERQPNRTDEGKPSHRVYTDNSLNETISLSFLSWLTKVWPAPKNTSWGGHQGATQHHLSQFYENQQSQFFTEDGKVEIKHVKLKIYSKCICFQNEKIILKTLFFQIFHTWSALIKKKTLLLLLHCFSVWSHRAE